MDEMSQSSLDSDSGSRDLERVLRIVLGVGGSRVWEVAIGLLPGFPILGFQWLMGLAIQDLVRFGQREAEKCRVITFSLL